MAGRSHRMRSYDPITLPTPTPLGLARGPCFPPRQGAGGSPPQRLRDRVRHPKAEALGPHPPRPNGGKPGMSFGIEMKGTLSFKELAQIITH